MSTKFKLKKRGASAPLSVLCDPIPLRDMKSPWSDEDRVMVVQLVRNMLRSKSESMSANQIGGTGRVFCTNIEGDVLRIFMNPELDIIDYDEEQVTECCASFPRSDVLRHRHRHVIVFAHSFAGNPFYLDTADPLFNDEVSKRLSYRIQHEMEHLDGINVRADPELQMGLDEVQPAEAAHFHLSEV